MTISLAIICIFLVIVFLLVGIVYFFITLARFFDHCGYSAFESAFIVVLCVIAALNMTKISIEYGMVEKCEASLERNKICVIEKSTVIQNVSD